ncbi:PP2C family protein-serine/threonine phosphatase [Prochlorococcus sp. MIT 1307]|uniref:PP2C family protein-serine/threonine phosphatase n=1 Tax=Prochlorococcus sp. MIT 1307 TaxID=3096219 RepID=UPI002A7587A5|nr:PP2C family protein-serine/threonine phosphatase [Prochlorococcus sp. MIT 1307]
MQSNQKAHSASDSFRELLDSLSTEQRCNQELLSSLGFALRSFTNLHRFLELVPVVASRLVGVEGALLVPFQADGRLWREQIQALPFDQNQELLRQIASLEGGLSIGFGSDPTQLVDLDRLVQRHMSKANIFATSLVARGKQRGRLYVFDTQGAVSLSEVHRRHLQLVADLAGVAIENDQTLQEIRRHESVDRQLSIGAEIQAQLLPDRCPEIEGVQLAARCRPAFQVGGDYYDFMSTRPELIGKTREKGRWALVIGDVMGKGVPAGLLMTMLRGMLRAEVLSGLPPDRILHDLNQLAQVDLEHSHRFITLFYSDFDPCTRRLRYANAAHNPPLLWRAEQRSISRLDAPGLLIGLQFDANYGCGSITLEPGDVLLYYTDGVTEAPGIAGDRFDEPRLIKSLEESCRNGLGAQEILNKLFARLDHFVGIDHQLEDDASMVLLKVNDELTLPIIE